MTDRTAEGRTKELGALVASSRANGLSQAWVTTRTIRSAATESDVTLNFIPTSEICYSVGHNIIHGKRQSGIGSF